MMYIFATLIDCGKAIPKVTDTVPIEPDIAFALGINCHSWPSWRLGRCSFLLPALFSDGHEAQVFAYNYKLLTWGR